MATTIDSLSASDKQDFLGRLSKFGLDASAILQPDLVVPPKSKLTLSLGSANSFTHPHVLVTKDIDELKQWIGLPDSAFQRGTLKSPPAPPPFRVANPQALERVVSGSAAVRPSILAPTANAGLASRDLDNARQAAISFIWGNSADSATYKPVIQQIFPVIQIPIWLFLTITVSAGSVLQLGPGYNVLCAWKIIIQEGGTIAAEGGLKVECTILQKTQPLIIPMKPLAGGVLVP